MCGSNITYIVFIPQILHLNLIMRNQANTHWGVVLLQDNWPILLKMSMYKGPKGRGGLFQMEGAVETTG